MDKYIVAVSGGVDSVVLIHMLKNKSLLANYQLPTISPQFIVAHFDHGIRPDSGKDALFVKELADEHGLMFEVGFGQLGKNASEAQARKARYDFLNTVREKHSATGIITAHHQDDELETAIINMLRGTGHRGLLPMRANKQIIRPLLDTPKSEIIKYAESNGLKWREDSTNTDTSYLRNSVRASIMPKLSVGQSSRDNFLKLIRDSSVAGSQLEDELAGLLFSSPNDNQLERRLINKLPHAVGRELVAKWLRANGIKDYDQKTLERLTIAAKTGRNGTKQPIDKGNSVLISKTSLSLHRNG